ncbi:MAG: hypothetical protein HON70_41330, partial [Lentisphaerae bacterium]|nr:hypothetical protein [Lentisphaerota bacterium]
VSDLVPCELAAGTASVAINVNRREIGRMRAVNDLAAPSGLVDPLVHVLRISQSGSARVGLMVNYTAHPLTMARDVPLISADFPGQAMQQLESTVSIAHAQFLQGCAGNVNVKISGGEQEAARAGELLAKGVLTAVDAATPCGAAAFDVSERVVQLPWQAPPPLDEARALLAKAQAGEPLPDIGGGEIALDWAEALHQTLQAGPPPAYARVLVQALCLGDVVLLALPGEVFVEIGRQIRERTEAGRLLIAAYANSDEVGYVPTASAFPEGGYEVDVAPCYYGLFKLAPECEGVLVEAGVACVEDVLR